MRHLHGKITKWGHYCQSTQRFAGQFTHRLSSVGNRATELTEGSQCDKTATAASRAKAFKRHTSDYDGRWPQVPGYSTAAFNNATKGLAMAKDVIKSKEVKTMPRRAEV
eukprot:scaffold26318_cov52-Cyclotella_meneghiniana.AAC.4